MPDLYADAALLLWNHTEPLLGAVDASSVEKKETLADLPPPPVPTSYDPTRNQIAMVVMSAVSGEPGGT